MLVQTPDFANRAARRFILVAAASMSLRKTSVAFWASISVFGLLVASWFVLNHYRVLYYNDSIEGPSPQTSPYWTIIHVQDLLLVAHSSRGVVCRGLDVV
jgi:hypothetical protein